ncbi:hypothetical protein Hanom_Chr01g00044361 [Helianthus anomalus]
MFQPDGCKALLMCLGERLCAFDYIGINRWYMISRGHIAKSVCILLKPAEPSKANQVFLWFD